MTDEAAKPGPPTFESVVEEGERTFSRIWKFIAAEGFLAVAFGTALIIWPDIGLSALVWIVGVYALVRGVVTSVGAFMTPVAPSERRWLFLQAAVATGVGIAVLAWPDISAKALLYVIAGYAIAVGVLLMGSALYLPLSGGRRLLLALSGMIFVAYGAVMFIEPGEGALAQIALIASLMIVTGVTMIGFAFELRDLVGKTRRTFERPATTTPAKPVAHG
ncbi:MAG TPA: DUF308 domain-containing protein [Gaiellaceae bacterium]|nr:DUF308 domain-containing protein [Gaiellaceae bacterium]